MKIINLLPPDSQNELRLEGVQHLVQKFWTIVVVSLALFLAFGFGIQQYLRIAVTRTERDIADTRTRLESSDLKEVQDQVVELNNSLTEIISLRSQQYKWSEVMLELARILPHEAQLNSLQMDRQTGRVDILGRALDRDHVIETWANLKQSELFYDVNFPLPNLERPTDSNFTFTFFVKLDRIKHDGP